MAENSLQDFYRLNFAMVHHHKWDLEQFENLLPFERKIYATMVKEHLEALKQGQGRT